MTAKKKIEWYTWIDLKVVMNFFLEIKNPKKILGGQRKNWNCNKKKLKYF